MTEQPTDEELMRRIARGDGDAVSTLYHRHGKALLLWFRKMLSQDHERAQDLLQDVFVRIVDQAKRYQSGRPFRPWMYTIAWNLLKNEFRYRMARPHAVHDADLLPSDVELPDTLADQATLRKALTHALEHLSPEHRAVVALRWYQDLPLQDIADILGVPLGTVKSRCHAALKQLQASLASFASTGDLQ